MGFVKTQQELDTIFKKDRISIDFYNGQQLMVYWETKQEIVDRLVPRPLKPVKPMIAAYAAYFPRTNFCNGYGEGGLFIPVEYKGEIGTYCLSMPLDKDTTGIALGREAAGFPKKSADIFLERRGNHVEAWIERNGIRFFEVEAEMDGEPNVKEFLPAMGAATGEDSSLVFNYMYDLEFWNQRYEFNNVRMIKDYNRMNIYFTDFGHCNIKLTPSADDPWAELEIVRVLGARYRIQDVSMCQFEVAERFDKADDLVPYLLKDWDVSLYNWDTRLFQHNQRDMKKK